MQFLVRQFLVTMVCVLVISGSVMAAPTKWQIPLLGTVSVPAGFNATEISSLNDKNTIGVNNKLSGAFSNLSKQTQGNFYYLTMDDGNAYHMAILAVMREVVPIASNPSSWYFYPNDNQRQMLQTEFNKFVEQPEFTVSPEMSIKLLGLDTFELGKIGGKESISCGARFLLKQDKFFVPVYVNGWMFNAKNHGAAVVLITTDSDRQFWNPVMGNILNSLKVKIQ